MNRIFSLLLLFFVPLFSNPEKELPPRYKIAVCVMATGSFKASAESLIESGRRFFCLNHDVTYFVFTNGPHLPASKDVVTVEQAHLGWPYDTLKRFHIYDTHAAFLENFDYIFSIDANMVFVAAVGEEILSDLVATQHPAFLKKRGAYENKKISSAYVAPQEGQHYFTGRFYGGTKVEFLQLLKMVKKQVDIDLAKNYIARWHDESYLNRYLIDHPPTRILNPSYCYPDDWQLEFPKKIISSCKSLQRDPAS
jgi:histo-blood group ABO system transferase